MGTNDSYMYEPLRFDGVVCRIAIVGQGECVEVWQGLAAGWVRTDRSVQDIWTMGERVPAAELERLGVPSWAH